jgi:hypothetical protein
MSDAHVRSSQQEVFQITHMDSVESPGIGVKEMGLDERF